MADIYRKSMPIIGFANANINLGSPAPANVTSSSKGLLFVNTNSTPVRVNLICYGATAGSNITVSVCVPGSGSSVNLFSNAGTLLLPLKAKQVDSWDPAPNIAGLFGYEIY
jgi:hypothetical protein